MSKEIRQLPEETTPTTSDWYVLQKASNNQTSRVSGTNLIPAGSVTGSKLNSNAVGIPPVLIGTGTLSGAADTISLTGLPAFTFLEVRYYVINSGSINTFMQFNADTAGNYSRRYSVDGTADATATSQTSVLVGPSTGSYPMFGCVYIINVAAQEKLVHFASMARNTAGAATAPTRNEGGGKWVNTSAQISRIDLINTSTGDFASGSTMRVFGYN